MPYHPDSRTAENFVRLYYNRGTAEEEKKQHTRTVLGRALGMNGHAPPGASSEQDPLAALARLIGQEDPFNPSR